MHLSEGMKERVGVFFFFNNFSKSLETPIWILMVCPAVAWNRRVERNTSWNAAAVGLWQQIFSLRQRNRWRIVGHKDTVKILPCFTITIYFFYFSWLTQVLLEKTAAKSLGSLLSNHITVNIHTSVAVAHVENSPIATSLNITQTWNQDMKYVACGSPPF